MNLYYRATEARDSHGYPGTAWLQMALCYGCGIYTAKSQGIIRNQIFKNFWAHHYFDWIMWAKRSAIVGVAGGFVMGTFMFGNPKIATKRAISKYNYWMLDRESDFRANEGAWHTKINN